jgi:hypothetical protein
MSPYSTFATVRSQESAGLVANTCFIGIQWKFVANVILLRIILITSGIIFMNMFVYKAIHILHISDVQMSNIILKMNLKKFCIFWTIRCAEILEGTLRDI